VHVLLRAHDGDAGCKGGSAADDRGERCVRVQHLDLEPSERARERSETSPVRAAYAERNEADARCSQLVREHVPAVEREHRAIVPATLQSRRHVSHLPIGSAERELVDHEADPHPVSGDAAGAGAYATGARDASTLASEYASVSPSYSP